MAYFPTSQIKKGLKTNGKTYRLSTTKEPYAGSYWETSMGQKFSGLGPNDPTTVLLENQVDNEPTNDAYNVKDITPKRSRWTVSNFGYKTPNPTTAPQPPIGIYPKPTEEDYKLGQFIRYFLKSYATSQYIEISKELYNKYVIQDPTTQYPLYKYIKITWQLSGTLKEVESYNSKTVKFSQKRLNLPGFYQYFHNEFGRFYKFKPGENLFTRGDEFINSRTGAPYIGYYHIHPDKGAMIGKQHTTEVHETLTKISIPVTEKELETITEKKEEERVESIRVIRSTPTVRPSIPSPTIPSYGGGSGGTSPVGGGGGGSGGGGGGGY